MSLRDDLTLTGEDFPHLAKLKVRQLPVFSCPSPICLKFTSIHSNKQAAPRGGPGAFNGAGPRAGSRATYLWNESACTFEFDLALAPRVSSITAELFPGQELELYGTQLRGRVVALLAAVNE